jgi:hypothetical protein
MMSTSVLRGAAGIFLGLVTCGPVLASGGFSDLQSDTWVATDALGRALPGKADCGAPRSDRYVGIFYFLWLGQHSTTGPYDITKLLAANPTNPAWGPVGAFHHWGESEVGYYYSNDEWVIRRHCHQLVDAGVDVLIFDVSNGYAYTSNYILLCNVFTQIRAEGGRTPQICFLAATKGATVVQALYDDLYSKNLYSDLWFRWQGKPLMLYTSDGLNTTLSSFFTFRYTWAWSTMSWFGTGQDKWTWLDNYPQNYGWHTAGVPEEVSVCAAQHPVTNIGRSYHDGAEPDAAHLQTDEGLCFAEQASRALEVDPPFIFITGWNEWVAQRFVSDGTNYLAGNKLAAGQSYFVDAYNQEYSRDIEPMKGGHTDNYYYQMIDLIRRYKGVRDQDPASAPRTVAVDGQFADWDGVQPDYWDTPYDTVARNHVGWGSTGTYVNTTGRNDFTHLKVTYDASNVYFYAETRATITARTGDNWMLLYIDADHNHATGWEGYDFVVNRTVTSATMTTLQSNTNGSYNWSQVADVSYAVSGNKIEIAIPRASLGMAGTADLMFDFHWADNIQTPGDIIAYCVNGDSAPNRRFNYRFNTLSGSPAAVTGLSTTHDRDSITLSWTNSTSPDVGRAIVRYSTTAMPASATEGTSLFDAAVGAGSSTQVVHEGPRSGDTYYYAVFACDLDGNYSAASTTSARLVPGDADSDDDVDQTDYGWFQTCFSGEGVKYESGCNAADLDFDLDVDRQDFVIFERCLGGANQTPGC